MDCRRAREYLCQFLDGELDKQTGHALKEHLAQCPLCNLEMEQEKSINDIIRENIPEENAPFELKEKVIRNLAEKKPAKCVPFPSFQIKPVLVTVLAALFLSIVFFSLFENRPFPVFSESVLQHINFLQGKSSIEISSGRFSEVKSWLQGKLDFKVAVPDLSYQSITLLGARICSLKDKSAAYIIYERDGHKLSVIMFDAKGIKLPAAEKVVLNKKIFYLAKEKGYNSLLWIDKGIACVFVSDLDEAELLHLASL